MEAAIIVITTWYLLNIIWLIYGFTKVQSFTLLKIEPKTRFSVIVPFRNEAQNLPNLLESINQQEYPKDLFEVILVDDESSDNFYIPDFNFQISVLKNDRKTNSPKKDAINTAISNAKNEWIITTDADCIVSSKWLLSFDAFIQQNNTEMIASGVCYRTKKTILDYFQQLDLLSLQGTTIGSFGNAQAFMCNGANFAYKKDFFISLGGFDGNEEIASGDDVFLLQKAMIYDQNKVHFVKSGNSIVLTHPEKNWSDLFYQRVRWANKTGNYSDKYSKQLGLSVFLMNLTCIISLLLWLTDFISLEIFTSIIVLKFLVDYILIRYTANFFKTNLNYIFLSSLIYPFWSTSVVFYSFFGSYNWKGRTFKT